MIKRVKYLSILLLVFALVFDVSAEGLKDGKKRIKKTSGSPTRTYMNINNISTHFLNDGQSDNDQDGNSGFIYPKGTGKAAFFQTGFVFGGKIDGEVRISGATYQSGLLGGKINDDGTPEDPEAANVRIYRVRRDYKTGSMNAEVRQGEGTESSIKAQYAQDWNEWPWEDGAPYTDVDGDGAYDPSVDIPGFPGADQTIWFVANDANEDQSVSFYGSTPMMAEMQVTVWGYALPAPLGNMIFRKYKLINKNSKPYTEFYVSVWSDPDLGDATDDFAGCDTNLSLGYIYNSVTSDGVYKEGAPAAGFDYFQGPIVDGEATDTAIFNNQYVLGKKNLGMSAFYYFINSNAVYADPTFGVYDFGALRFYNLLEGKIATTGEYFPVPDALGGGVTKFPLSGDPVTGTGYTDGIFFDPGDRRIGMVSGPFTMAPGDTQEVVVAQMAAGGTGYTNLQSVALLKTYSEVAQNAYDKFFNLPAAPRLPDVKVTELENEVILNWGWNQEQVNETESHDKEHYKFQGYNVYQLPSANSTKDNAVRVATYDVVDDVKFILGPEVDPSSGLTLDAVQQYGSDSGIKRELSITTDYIAGGPLVNGKKYYFAVSSYAYNPDSVSIATNLENSLNVLTVVPHFPNPGTVYGGKYKDTLAVTHTSTAAMSDGIVYPIVVDPAQLTGHNYEVTFHEDGDGNGVWNLTDVTTGQVKLSEQANQTGDEEYLNTDGLLVKVLGPDPGIKGDGAAIVEVAYGGTPVTGSPYGGDRVWASYNSTGDYLVGSGGGVAYSRLIRNPAALKNGHDYEIRFTDAGGYAIHYYADDMIIHVPFELWDTGVSTPDDPSDDYRMIPFINPDDGVTTSVFSWTNGVAWDQFPSSDWIYGRLPASTATSTESYDQFAAACDASGGVGHVYSGASYYAGAEAFARLIFAQATSTGTPPPTGTVIRMITNKPNSSNDVFSFNVPATYYSADEAKANVEMINIFPNPYYGASSEELNKYQKFVTISHLPNKATIKIFNLAGQLVRTLHKNSNDQFLRWDLANESGLPVASGLFIIHVDMPDLGKTKVLKAAIIQEQQILDRF